MTDFTEAFPHNLLRGILKYSKETEPWVVCRMPPSFKKMQGMEGVLDWAKQWNANAIIGQFDPEDDVKSFLRNGIVAVAQDFKSRFSVIPNITGNYIETGRMVADFFLRKGYKNFAYLGYKEVVWSDERYEGFKQRVEEEGCAFYDYREQSLESLWYYQSTPVVNWLKSLPWGTAIMSCDDTQGNKVLELARALDIKVPEQLAVVGVDNDETICNLSDPPLSSVSMNIEKAGYEVASLIDDLVHHPGSEYRDIIIEPQLIISRLSSDIFSTTDSVILKALTFIHHNLSARITVQDIVKVAPLSRRMLEIRFKKVTGKSIHQYIFDLRMERFSQLLLETDDSIADIAMEVGLADAKNLSRQFKLWKACTPNEYRMKNRLR